MDTRLDERKHTHTNPRVPTYIYKIEKPYRKWKFYDKFEQFHG